MDYLKLYLEDHLQNGKTLKLIAQEQGVTYETIKYHFRKLNLVSRKGKFDYSTLNHSVFDTWTPEMAYWLGFFAADGHVSDRGNSIQVKLMHSDKGHLIKFGSFFLSLPDGCITDTLDTYKGEKRLVARLWFTSRKIKNRLSDLGITHLKTYTDTDFLKYVPMSYKIYFVLGYFDGDGSYRTSTYNPQVSFIGTYSFLSSLRDFMSSTYDFSPHVSLLPSGSWMNTVSWGSFKDVIAFSRLHSSLLGVLPLQRKLSLSLKFLSSFYPTCSNCGAVVGVTNKSRLCASCLRSSVSKKPSKSDLIVLLSSHSFVSIGRIFGVSDNAVRKWAKFYGLL